MKNRLYAVEGMKLAVTALDCMPEKVRDVYCTAEYFSELSGRTQNVTVVDERDLKKISQHKTPPGVLALVETVCLNLADTCFAEGIYYFLDGVQDPGNVGTIIRTCDWFGVDGLFLGEGCADLYNPKVIQSGMGSHFRLNVISCDFEDCMQYLKPDLIAGTEAGGSDHLPFDMGKTLLCLGSEGSGLSQAVRERCSKFVGIRGREDRAAESLNVSMVAAILADRYFSGQNQEKSNI